MAERLSTGEVGAIKRNALRLSLTAITSVFIFEFAAGIFTNSLALITDGTHALLDAVVTAILIIATTLALKPRDADHPYGHGKIETIGGFIGGAALFVVAIFFIYEASIRIAAAGSTSLVNPGVIGFAAIIYTLAVDGFRITVLRRAIKKAAGTTTLKADFYHAFADLASTAVAFVGLWLVTAGFGHGDSVAAILLGGFLAYLSSRFAYQNAMELTDVISPKLVAKVREAANDTEGVLECDDIKMHRVGREIFVEATIALRADISFENAHEISAQVEGNIAKSLSGTGLDVRPRNVTVHFEPAGIVDLPPESIIEKAAGRVKGVRGVHNILVSKIGGTESVGVSLHIQVNRSATLVEAHSVANAVEDSIRRQLRGAESITVHLEPLMPEIGGMEPLVDGDMQNSIMETVLEASDVKKVGKVETYRTAANVLIIDVDCAFSSEMTIEQIHERVSEIEKQIRTKYPGSIVTIHAEPS
ncbi:MAG TPA: cation diffusion facilitator family transporter [Nitrososphaera sp.]|nr:cation diffusion facilitator family transporter [Nitrososphaera sp.]